MKIVIDIPEEMYQKIKETNIVISGRRNGKRIDYILFNAVYAGTLLPKGHGRLIDEKEVYKKLYCRCLAGVAEEVLKETQTIIEADKEESEEV